MNRIYIIVSLFIILIFVGCKSGDADYTIKYFDTETKIEITEEQTNGLRYYESHFDTDGDEIERYYYNRNGKLDFCFLKVNKIEYVYDTRGNIITESYFGKTHKPEIDANAIHRKTYEYDVRDNLIALNFFGANGDEILSKSGTYRSVHRIEYMYDENDSRTAEVFFGLSDEPTNNFLGYHRAVTTFENIGGDHKPKSTCYFNLDSSAGTNGYGVYRIENEYDDEGKLVIRKNLNKEGEPVNNGERIHRYEYIYNADGELVEEFGYDINDAKMGYRKMKNVSTYNSDE